MSPSWPQILIVIVLLVLLFGRGRISSLMSEVAKGIKSFRRSMDEKEDSSNDESNEDNDNKPNTSIH